MKFKKELTVLVLGVFFFGIFSGILIAGQNSKKYDIRKMYELYFKTLDRITNYYVDSVAEGQLIEKSLETLVNSLDPFSEFMTPDESRDFQIHTQGAFGGIGIQIGLRDNWLTVIAPIDGTPAMKVGLMAGDRIIEINGESTKGWKLSKAVKVLRGDPGTKVRIKVARKGVDKPLEFEITRAIIKIKSVPFYTILKDDIGYVRFTEFTNNSSIQLKDALLSLKREGAKRFIVDVRTNPGGLLSEAVKTASLFLESGKVVVSTRGRTPSSVEVDTSVNMGDAFTDVPILLLVDRGSASASEILAGAIQDWDRGIVMGDTTFGKGSVQRLFPLDYGYILKITVAKYYTPSGRCIHKSKWHGFLEDESDTLKTEKEFHTLVLKRPVYSGGGISPDIYIVPDTIGGFIAKLLAKSAFFNFAVEYKVKHGAIPEKFDLSKEILDEFKDYLRKNGIEFKDYEFKENIDIIKRVLGSNIAEVYFGEKGRYSYLVAHDPIVKKAVSILSNIENIRDIRNYLKTNIKNNER